MFLVKLICNIRNDLLKNIMKFLRRNDMKQIVIERADCKITVTFSEGGEDVIQDVKRMLIDSFNQRIQEEKNNDKKSELPIQGVDEGTGG